MSLRIYKYDTESVKAVVCYCRCLAGEADKTDEDSQICVKHWNLMTSSIKVNALTLLQYNTINICQWLH